MFNFGILPHSKNRLPTSGLLLKMMTPDMIDTIGLSVSDYLSIRSELRPIFFIDADTRRTDGDIATLAFASAYLNNGWELTGGVAKGLALYIEGTSPAILAKAYRFFGQTYPVSEFGPTWVEPGTWDDNQIWSEI